MRVKLALVPRMGEDIVVEEAELEEPGEHEVRLKVMTCTICHSDIHALKGEHGAFEGPGTAGHEVAGIVDKVGSKVTYVKEGDRVLSSLVRQGCGHCIQCLNDRHWFCMNLPPFQFRVPSAYIRDNGERCIQTMPSATGFAEYTNSHESCLCKLDDDIPFAIGSALACGFMSGFGAVLNRCQIKQGESFAVIGCGGTGLSGIMAAKLVGAFPIIAIDTQDSKLDAAKKFGATDVINPKKTDAVQEVLKITGCFGVDHSFVAVAGKGIKRQANDMTAAYGRLVFIGHARYEDEFMDDMNWMDIICGKVYTGCVMGGITLRRDVPLYMDMYRRGMVDIDSLLTNRFTLDNIGEAMESAQKGALKNVVVIGGE